MVTCSCRVLYHLAHQSLADWGGGGVVKQDCCGVGPGVGGRGDLRGARRRLVIVLPL